MASIYQGLANYVLMLLMHHLLSPHVNPLRWLVSGCCFSFSHVYFVTPWTAACQVPLSFTVSHSLLKFTSLELVMLSNHLILRHPLLLLPSVFPSIRVFSSELAHQKLGGQSIRASASILPMNFQGWSPFGLTGLISLLTKELSRVFSNTTIWKHQFFSTQPSLWSNSQICTWLLEKP